MTWNTNDQESQETQQLTVKCNSNTYNVSGLSGLGLVEKLKAIARENSISKFDIFDSTNKNVSSEDIENGLFTGDLSIVRFNAAA